MLDIGIALGLALVGFALGYGTREIVLYRRRQAAVSGRQPRRPKRSPDRRQVLRSGLPPGGLRLRFAPSRDPLKRNSHTLVRSCFIGKDASSKENHCDIFTTITVTKTGR
jgi:hypothetical protein